jgi:predicted metal-dependent phosphoesterase TrpH
MPALQPFTKLCQFLNRPRTAGRADLHVHTTASDGLYTPAEVINLARRSGLAAVAITDHDTLDAIPAAQDAAGGSAVEVVPGVEITAELDGHELHLLGYCIRLDDRPLNAALARLREHREQRFWGMVERLRRFGVSVDREALQDEAERGVLSRRNLAVHLVKMGEAGSVREAFQRFLGDNGRATIPKVRLPVAEAIRLVRGAGGLASWAHPSGQCTRESLLTLRALGLQAVEAYYPSFKKKWTQQLCDWAGELGLAVTGGSDCHGPDQPSRAIGTCSLAAEEWEVLRQLANADELVGGRG